MICNGSRRGLRINEIEQVLAHIFALDPMWLIPKPAEKGSQRIAICFDGFWSIEADLHFINNPLDKLIGLGQP